MPAIKRKAGSSYNKAKRQRVVFRKQVKKRFTRAAKKAVIDGALGYAAGGPAGAAVGAVGGAVSGFTKKVKGKKIADCNPSFYRDNILHHISPQ